MWGGPYGNFGSSLRPLRLGERGSDVFELQKLLKDKGYYKANPDGIYGDSFRNAIHKFQKDNDIPVSDNIGYGFYKKLGVKLVE
ncbi:peptidoglycan-binding domain-containing protein [Clostridium ganghwense]|uniref:Peptidoglycan-binding domain-containing protein n=1 Tax=Clostridium ganghwense TaxID=312089 RepID=A0ABT4CQD4_9CLOT|nr:peptidoglycan-binding domain-containing protein [Clostridium ganghwense]